MSNAIKLTIVAIVAGLLVFLLLSSSCFVVRNNWSIQYFGVCSSGNEYVVGIISIVGFIISYFILRKLIDIMGI